MSHIVEFTIEHLAGRREPLSLKMDRHINIMFGLNGCGKTSLLKILHSAMSNDATMLARVPFSAASVSIHSLNWNKTFRRTIVKSTPPRQSPTVENATELRVDESDAIIQAQSEREILKWKTTPQYETSSTVKWHHQYLPTTRLLLGGIDPFRYSNRFDTSNVLSDEDRIDMFFAESMKQLWTRYTSSLLSSIRKAQDAGLASILKAVVAPQSKSGLGVKSSLDSHHAYDSMKKFLARQGSPQLLSNESNFKRRYENDNILRQVVKDIDNIESEIEEVETPRRQLNQLISELFSGGKKLILSDNSIEIRTSEGVDIGAASLSSGEKHLLMLLVETLLSAESSIIVDEPEISMHIDWQKRIVQIMRLLNPLSQIIIATHSPEVLTGVDDNNITRI
jgi:predicted ATP-binding protein involved in virulence